MKFSHVSTLIALSASASNVFAHPTVLKRGRGKNDGESDPTDLPVCIIGAGPSGLTAAQRLQKQGLKSMIFEKQAEVGGKCQSYYDEKGQYHPLGALLYSQGTYPKTLEVIRSTSIKGEEILPKREEGHRWQYSHTTGDIKKSMSMNWFTDKALEFDVSRYSRIWREQYEPYAVVGYKHGVPKDFTISTREWLEKHHLYVLRAAFIAGMVLYGYGDYEQIPILYTLRYFTPDIIDFFASKHPGYLIDYHAVWTEWTQKYVHQPIRLNSRISKIDRPEGGNPSVRYSIDGKSGEMTQECASLILAFPPTLKNLHAAGLDLSDEEQTIFGKVITENYYSGAVKVRYPGDFTFTHVSEAWYKSPPADGEVVLSIKLWADNDIATIYSWDDLYNPKMKSYQEAYDMTKKCMSIFNKPDPSNNLMIPKPVSDADMRAFRSWDYFPRVMAQGLRDGFYEKFHEIQGKQDTYYASGLNSFEMVEFAIEAGEDIVENYLIPNMRKSNPGALKSASQKSTPLTKASKDNKPKKALGQSPSDDEEFFDFSDSENEEFFDFEG